MLLDSLRKCISPLVNTILLAVQISGHRVEAPPVQSLYAIGTSETVGFGLQNAELAYPALLAQHCPLHVHVSASVGTPISYANLPRFNRDDFIVLFFGFDDVLAFSLDHRLDARIGSIFDRIRSAARILILVEPPLRELPATRSASPFLNASDRGLRVLLRHDAISLGRHTRIVFLHSRQSLLTADGMHPNEAGQVYLAGLIVRSMPVSGCSRI